MPEEPIPPRLDYATPEPRRFTPVLRILLAIVALTVGILVLLPRLNRPHVYTNQDHCASNLHQIGLGILLYCSDNNGVFPDSLQTLARLEGLTPQVFICPSSSDSPSTAPTTQAQVDDLNRPGHCSYIYLGKGLTTQTVLPNQVIACEPLSNHAGGINVLLSDGHAEFVNVPRATKIISDASISGKAVMLPP